MGNNLYAFNCIYGYKRRQQANFQLVCTFHKEHRKIPDDCPCDECELVQPNRLKTSTFENYFMINICQGFIA